MNFRTIVKTNFVVVVSLLSCHWFVLPINAPVQSSRILVGLWSESKESRKSRKRKKKNNTEWGVVKRGKGYCSSKAGGRDADADAESEVEAEIEAEAETGDMENDDTKQCRKQSKK